ncbi:MAG: Rieske 2Fe-2S domain-containing protein [Planctomycetaceae bacterium]
MARTKTGQNTGDQPSGSPAEKPARAAMTKAAAPKPESAKAVGSKGSGPNKPAASMPRDTASILAAARSGAKPGPVSKSEAAPGTRLTGSGAAKAGATVAKHAPATPAAKASPLAVPPMPAKPMKSAVKKDDAEEDRRGFLQLAVGSFLSIGFTALSISGGLFTLGLARFFFPNVLAEPPSRFKVGFKEGFPAGKVETKFVAQYGVWVVNSEFQGQQQIYALKTVCTHLGCTPNWLEAEQKFKCPCHGSGFYKDGVNFEGPAPRPLERYAIRISDDGQLEVDKSRSFQEELGQWGDQASFVTV